MVFPPTPIFPKGIDNDYTLFLVFNTTETKICHESLPWAEEIEIIPVQSNQPEIWADNGFGNISGELFYYDSVEKNSHGKVIKLKKCARNLGGKSTKYNPPGTWIKSYVVAEHHNQLVDSVIKVEDFIGYNFDPREKTLDWRIRNLQNLEIIFDDFACPDVVFNWQIVENNPTTGIVAEYLIQIETTGATGAVTFRLDFGDGEYTNNTLSGTHRYALNSIIDPVLTLSNDKCQLITTPVLRNNPSEPEFIPEPLFEPFIPEFGSVPDFIIVPVNVPEAEINIPPLVIPCISLEGSPIGSIPSIIEGPDINIGFSYVLIEATNPVNITQSVVTIEGGPINIPSYVFVDIPPTIVIDPPIPPTIVVIASSNIELSLNSTNLPKLEIDWSNQPEMNINFIYPKRTKIVPIDQDAIENFGDEFADLMFAQDQVKVEVEEVGIPEEIFIIPPSSMPKIEFNIDNFPSSIKIDSSEVNIPSIIQFQGLESPIPDTISIDGSSIPDTIKLINDLPESISLVMDTIIPSKVEVELVNPIPDKIFIETITPIPSRIILEAIGIPDELKVTGIPDTIEVVGFPDFLQLKMPENPEIELVYRGAPIEMKVNLESIISNPENGVQGQCFTLVPCRA